MGNFCRPRSGSSWPKSVRIHADPDPKHWLPLNAFTLIGLGGRWELWHGAGPGHLWAGGRLDLHHLTRRPTE